MFLAVLVIVALMVSSCPEDDDSDDNPCDGESFIYDLTRVEYGDYDNAYVSLTFRDTVGDGQGWVLEEEFIDPDGICNWGCY